MRRPRVRRRGPSSAAPGSRSAPALAPFVPFVPFAAFEPFVPFEAPPAGRVGPGGG